jgi:CRP-like cAMP-binding protein
MVDAVAIGAHALFRGVEPAVLAALASMGRAMHFEAGELLMREGDEAKEFFLVVRGAAALEVHVPPRETVRVATAPAGDVVGLSWMFPPARVQLDARALEPMETIAFDAGELRAVMDAEHDVGYALTRRLLRVTYDRLERVRLQRLDMYRVGSGTGT